jgi:hypothetical protein
MRTEDYIPGFLGVDEEFGKGRFLKYRMTIFKRPASDY